MYVSQFSQVTLMKNYMYILLMLYSKVEYCLQQGEASCHTFKYAAKIQVLVQEAIPN